MNLNAIDLRMLRSFLVLSRSNSFIVAAEKLHISQPALSRQMKDLAERIGIPLFERIGRRSVLTNAGEELVATIEPLLDSLDRELTKSSAQTREITGNVKVGATQIYLKNIAIPSAAQLLSKFPKIRFAFKELSRDQILGELHEGILDLGILPRSGDLPGLESIKLFTEKLAVVGKASLMKNFRRELTLKSLGGIPLALLDKTFLMRQRIEEQADLDGVVLDVRISANGAHNLLSIVQNTELLTIGSALLAMDAPGIVARPLNERAVIRDAVICWNRDKILTLGMSRYIDAAVINSHELIRNIRLKAYLKRSFAGKT